MEEMVISTTIGMDGISLASKEATVKESSVIIFLVDGQGEIIILIEELGKNCWHKFRVDTSPRRLWNK
ncbi:hypothetical protein RchiOBHm_Chr1g0369811 [Rosa chinensis]|uniref:Uncharacterized protein n=1 Tax=Rosa chinensis TaxID=74649 RepID=A0A2P6SL45_ROSCH|nr:hypothetical protein RchiOBHm_Chr1g0369811 [Rosa chinensis]